MKSWKTNLHIIWTIAVKDIVDAIQNKTTISIILGVVLTMLSGQALPLLLMLNAEPTMAVYDVGDARLVDALRRREGVRVYPVRSQDELERLLTERTEPVLGLLIPADFDATLANGKAITLTGYAAHWVKAEKLAELQATFEVEIRDITGQTIPIDASTPRLYPAADANGQPVMVTMSLVMATILICVILVPYLMIDEKQTHTIDVLLVSPASVGQIVAAKAITGLTYGLIAGCVAVVFSRMLVVHWWVALLAVLCGTVFAVAVGLVLGSFFDNPQNMSVWMGLVMMLLLVPVFANMMAYDDWPALVRFVLPQMPTGLMAKLFRLSFVERIPIMDVLWSFALILVWSVPLYAMVVWQVRRADC